MITENLALFFADFGQAATWNGNTTYAILDAATEDLLGGRVLSTDYVMQVEAAGFPGIARDAVIVIGAASYQVREVRARDDGAVLELTVRKL